VVEGAQGRVISVILTAVDDAKPLARLLTALVPAAAEGLVREVAVVGASGAAAEVAEDCGASLYAAFGEALAKARGPWIAAMPLSSVLAPDWIELLAEHLRRDPAQPARLTARGFSFSHPEGWLVPKALAASVGALEQDLQRIARRGGRRLRVLDRSRNRSGDRRRR
jgi:hypothetical protein